MGPWLRAIGRSLWPALHSARSLASGLWLAWHADPGRAAGVGLRVDPDVREGAGSLGGEQADPEQHPAASLAAAVRHLQAEIPVQHADGLAVDGREFLRLLCDLGHAGHVSTEG